MRFLYLGYRGSESYPYFLPVFLFRIIINSNFFKNNSINIVVY